MPTPGAKDILLRLLGFLIVGLLGCTVVDWGRARVEKSFGNIFDIPREVRLILLPPARSNPENALD